MRNCKIVKIQEKPEIKQSAANWFHEKWDVPVDAYLESMEACMSDEHAVPQWYIVMAGDEIIGGAGVIENDFHDRKDLSPNLCALYVEERYRCQGIAGQILNYVCEDMKKQGIHRLYLITEHTSFYERYSWQFLCMVQGDGEEDLTRMYVHEAV